MSKDIFYKVLAAVSSVGTLFLLETIVSTPFEAHETKLITNDKQLIIDDACAKFASREITAKEALRRIGLKAHKGKYVPKFCRMYSK